MWSISRLNINDYMFLTPWVKHHYNILDKMYLVANKEDMKMWERHISLIGKGKSKTILVETPPETDGWVMESPIDCFLHEDNFDDLKFNMIDEVKELHFNVIEYYMNFNTALLLKEEDCFPEFDFKVHKNSGECIRQTDIPIYRYRLLGDDRVRGLLSNLGSMGELYLKNVWSTWVLTHNINKSLEGNNGYIHPFARLNKEFRYRPTYPIRHPRLIQSRLDYYNQRSS